MGTRDNKIELTAGMVDPVYDTNTGVWQDRAKGYAAMGGGVRIPSGDANTGAQLGPVQRIDQIVHFEPGGEGVSIDLEAIPLDIRNKIVMMETTVEARYSRMAKAAKELKEFGFVNPATYGETPAAPTPPAPAKVRIPQVAARVVTAEDPDTSFGEPEPKESPALKSMVGQLVDGMGAMLDRLSRLEKGSNPKPATPPVPPSPPPPSVPEPTVQVTMSVEGLGVWQVPYHAVVESGNTLALIFDKRFKSGSRFFPPVLGEERAIQLAIHDGQQGRKLVGFSVGLGFSHGDYEFTIMVIGHEEPDAR